MIASNVGGLPDLIEHGHNGLLFPTGDVAALATTMRQLLSDRSHAARIAAEGYDDAISKFDVLSMAETYLKHYLELLDVTAGARGIISNT